LKKKLHKKVDLLKKEKMNDASFLLQKTFSGPQNQLKSVTSMQSSLQKNLLPLLLNLFSLSME